MRGYGWTGYVAKKEGITYDEIRIKVVKWLVELLKKKDVTLITECKPDAVIKYVKKTVKIEHFFSHGVLVYDKNGILDFLSYKDIWLNNLV